MARELLIVWAGRHERSVWSQLCEEYRRRIERHMPTREIAVRTRGTGDERRRRREEGAALWSALPARSWAIALDRRGGALSSTEFAGRLGRLREEWPHSVAFLVGSDLGLDPELLHRVRQRLSLGPMTLPHELARLVLYEQLFRAMTLRAGIKYHRESLA